MKTYALHGLRVRSEIALGTPVNRSGPADIRVRWGKMLEPATRPSRGRLLAALRWGNDAGFTHARIASGYELSFHHICILRVGRDRRSIRVRRMPSADSGMVPILLAGNAIAFLLTLKGECVLHASAVDLHGSVIAFLGASGMGKSTLAALLCAEGARLVTDDLLRLAIDEAGISCHPGTSEIRLRSNAASLAGPFGSDAESTVDGRIRIRPKACTWVMPRLAAVVVPRPSRERRDLAVRRLTPRDAHFALLSYPRVAGLIDGELQRQHFHNCARVASRVPVYEAAIPWGPPFPTTLGAAFQRQLDLA